MIKENYPAATAQQTGPRLSRRGTLALWAGLPLLPALASTVAAAPAPGRDDGFRQVPGLMRWRVGDVELTAVGDGASTLPLGVVPAADPVVAKELADAAFLPPGGAIPIAINTYLVRSGTTLALVDTGGGRFFGPRAGALQQNLRAAGVAPEAIEILVLTHLHPDHVAGMTTSDGKAVFPNATFMVHAAELAY